MKTQYKTNLIFEEYAKVKACHKSALKSVDTSKHLQLFEETIPDSDALRFGKIFHTALLEPELMTDMDIYSDMEWIPKKDHPDGIGINDQKSIWRDGMRADDLGYFKNKDEKEKLELMVKSVMDNPIAKDMLSGNGDVEPSIFWTDKTTGLPCKTRLDFLRSDDVIVEVKTDMDPSPEAFGRKAYQYNYPVGAWFNREGFRAHFGRDIKAYVVIVVGKLAPHATAVYLMNAHDFDSGEIHGIPLMIRYKTIKRGGLNDYNQAGDGSYEILPLYTPAWELKIVDDAMGEIEADEEI